MELFGNPMFNRATNYIHFTGCNYCTAKFKPGSGGSVGTEQILSIQPLSSLQFLTFMYLLLRSGETTLPILP